MHDETTSVELSDDRVRLQKVLGLRDVYAISTGAMFSSGFFLLPGIASAETGPSVAIAYLLAGVLVLPAMLCAAELSTAMPRAGGPYYFLDRSLGPLVGTIGGFGTWVALAFKSAFALVGIGAYLGIYFDVPVRAVAAALALGFVLLNIVGVKKTMGLQLGLVVLLVVVLVFFVVAGLIEIFGRGAGAVIEEQFTPFTPFGASGLITTIGLVFVSYAGLTQVASVSEEVRDPGRNIPLGMMLSLLTATVVYVLGVAVMVGVLDPSQLRDDLTPVATAADEFLPQPVGTILIVMAALAAFASTGNGGILAAARYPLAMARDKLLWARLANVGRFHTPTNAVVVTGAATILLIVAFDVEAIAKLASAFILLMFGLLNLAVLVMRMSRIEAYDPAFRTPLYPWIPLAGIVVSVWLIAQMGLLASLFTGGVVAVATVWYLLYASDRVTRDGAIYHVFERWGRRRDRNLDLELVEIIREQDIRTEDRFDEVIARAAVVDLPAGAGYDEAVRRVAGVLSTRLDLDEATVAARFVGSSHIGLTPVANGAALPIAMLDGLEHPELVIVRAREAVVVDQGDGPPHVAEALFFVAADRHLTGGMLRILSRLSTRIEDEGFLSAWRRAAAEAELKELLIGDSRILMLWLLPESPAGVLVGRAVRDLELPGDCLISLIRRDGHVLVPRGSSELMADDQLTIVGDPAAINDLVERYGSASRWASGDGDRPPPLSGWRGA